MIRPSPNEFDRLKNEEFLKRRILRLKEVREHSKANASRLRHLYKEQKTKVINKIAENIQEQLNTEESKKILDLKSKYEKQCDALGDAHYNASDWTDPMIAKREKAETNNIVALERQEIAFNHLKVEKDKRDLAKNFRLESLNQAMLIEKERALAVASLPPPFDPFMNEELLKDMEDVTPRVRVCDRNKFSVIESYETFSYNVQRLDDESQVFEYGTNNAMEAGEIRQQHLSKINNNMQMESEEHSIKAQMRGHHAIKKQIVQKDYGELLTNLEQISKGEMAKRQKDYHKNELVGPNSAGHLGIGHTAAMVGYKERCRERAVESAVMESLKDITNKTSSQLCQVVDETETRGETKLSKLYDIIRKQKENVTFERNDNKGCQRTENYVENTDRERVECVSPDNIEKISEELFDHAQEDKTKASDDVLRMAAAAAIKSSSVLEKSHSEKERNIIEKKIQHLDRRLEIIKESETKSDGVSSRDSARSSVSETSRYNMHASSHRSEVVSVAPSSESACSESLNIIREFQRQALLKLSGHPSAQYSQNHLYTIGRQLSNLSLESSAASDNLRINQLIGSSNDTLQASSDCHSSVNEWVKTQLLQTIDKIPDWVTRSGTEPQFLPDLNMSFMSSILNIRSETGSTKDDTMSSCSTVMTHSSVLRHTERSSITEISKIGSTMEPGSFLRPNNAFETSFTDEQFGSVTNMSGQSVKSESSVKLRESESTRNASNVLSSPENKQSTDSVILVTREDYTISVPCGDLIDFQSVEDLVTGHEEPSEEEASYQRALDDLINMPNLSNYGQRTNQDCPDSKSRINGLPWPNDPQEVDSTLTANRDHCILTASTHDNNIISQYENFLMGLVNKTLKSPSTTCGDSLNTMISDNRPGRRFNDSTSLSTSQKTTKDSSDQMVNGSCSIVNGSQEQASYFTSTTREGQGGAPLRISFSPIQALSSIPDFVSRDRPQLLFGASDISSQGCMDQLSPYYSDNSGDVSKDISSRVAGNNDDNNHIMNPDCSSTITLKELLERTDLSDQTRTMSRSCLPLNSETHEIVQHSTSTTRDAHGDATLTMLESLNAVSGPTIVSTNFQTQPINNHVEHYQNQSEPPQSTSIVTNPEYESIDGSQDTHHQTSYFTSTTREGQGSHALRISYSPIQAPNTMSVVGSRQPFHFADIRATDMSSQSSMEQLSPYTSDTSETVISNSVSGIIRAQQSDESMAEYEDHEPYNQKKMRQLLSSTMKPNRCNIKTVSPDISSISSISAESCNRLKQRIMMEYFEKNKNLFNSASVSGTRTSDLSMKPLESADDDSTPRNPDSGKPSSRLTLEHSGENTGRLTADDLFMTPRTDNNWTDFTPRDEWSTSHTNFRALSDYTSTNNHGDTVADDNADFVDLNETLKNEVDQQVLIGSSTSVNLIDFESQDNTRRNADFLNEVLGYNQSQDSPGSHCMSVNSGSYNHSPRIVEDRVPSKESSSASMTSSFQKLESYHSLSESPSNPHNDIDIQEFDDSAPCYIQSMSDYSVDSRSDADTSSISLASFLKNESMCQQIAPAIKTQVEASTSKPAIASNRPIDNNEEMKNQLAQWKKDRLSRINQRPLETGRSNGGFVTKTSIIRQQDENEKKSRTLRLYNNLEEVQRQKQKKDTEQKKMENQLKKKEYAENLRRIKKAKPKI